MVLPLNPDLKLELLRNPTNRAIRYTTNLGHLFNYNPLKIPMAVRMALNGEGVTIKDRD